MIFLSGRILNRFAKDMGSVDEILPKIILDSSQVGSSRNDIMIGNVCICSMYHLFTFQIILNLAGSLILTVLTNYFLLIPLSIMFIILRILQKFYLSTSKDIKRIEGMGM